MYGMETVQGRAHQMYRLKPGLNIIELIDQSFATLPSPHDGGRGVMKCCLTPVQLSHRVS